MNRGEPAPALDPAVVLNFLKIRLAQIRSCGINSDLT